MYGYGNYEFIVVVYIGIEVGFFNSGGRVRDVGFYYLLLMYQVNNRVWNGEVEQLGVQ